MKKLLAILVACLMPICLIAGSGDVNGDGKVDIADIVELLNHLNGNPTKNYQATEADANNDGVVDNNDAKAIAEIVLGEQYKYFREESSGEEAIISSAGHVLLQKDNNDDGHYIEMCSYDAEAKSFSTEKCLVVEMDQQEQVRSFVFSDFAICLNHSDNGQIGLFLIRYNGELTKLGDVSLPAKSRALDSPDNPSLIGRLSTINDIWSAIGEPVKAVLGGNALNTTKWAGNLTGLFLAKSIEIPLERLGFDYSATVGGLFSLWVEGGLNIAAGGAMFSNPWTAGLFLLTSYQEGKDHIFKKTIGKDFSVSISSAKRVSWDHYQANYAVSGMGESLVLPEIDFTCYPRLNNEVWDVYPKTIRHSCLNQDYNQDMENLSPGPNKFIINVYIENWRFLGSFMKKEFEFFVGLNELTDVKIQDYNQGDEIITQSVLAYSANHNEAYPLSDFGTYIRCGDSKIEHYSHTKNVVESSTSSDGPSIVANNQVTQQLKIEIDINNLISVSEGSNKKKPSQDYFIGAYSYNFNTGKYEYYDERPLNLEFSLLKYCPDENHPHWIDLELPNGTLWRCCNEGASIPEEFGDYFTLDMAQSAATFDQVQELYKYCSYKWIKKNDVQGAAFTGSNGISIFLPAAGYYQFGYGYSWIGEVAEYWTSTSCGRWNNYSMSIWPSSTGYHFGDTYGIADKKQIRPVR